MNVQNDITNHVFLAPPRKFPIIPRNLKQITNGGNQEFHVTCRRLLTGQTVTINGLPADYETNATPSHHFYKNLSTSAGSGGIGKYESVTVAGTVPDSGNFYLPPPTETPVYDAEGVGTTYVEPAILLREAGLKDFRTAGIRGEDFRTAGIRGEFYWGNPRRCLRRESRCAPCPPFLPIDSRSA